MAGVTDRAFREICSEHGADLTCTEMISARAITYHNPHTLQMLDTGPGNGPVSVQLFGHEPEVMSAAVREIRDRVQSVAFDINMGCPMPKVVNNGDGSALMRDPGLAAEIVAAAVDASDRPVTVKIRKGYDDDHCNAMEVARRAEAAGAAAITVHGRTRTQYYSGEADWDCIAQVRQVVGIPVIANGDIRDADSARRCMELTGCEALAVGRAAQGNPWVFNDIKEVDDSKSLSAVCRHHFELMLEFDGAYAAVHRFRKHLAWYTKGMPGGARYRDAIMRADTPERMFEIINSIGG